MNPEEFFQEIENHLLLDEKPSEYLERAGESEMFCRYPFEMLSRMKETKQSPQYHPEGSVWIHTMMVVDTAAKYRTRSSAPRAFMWAALLHDIGKPAATQYRKGRITSYNHDLAGEKLAREFLEAVQAEKTLIEKVCGLVRYHMQILFVTKGGKHAQLKEMKRRVDIREAALFGFCDRMGRGNADGKREKENIKNFLRACGTTEFQ